MREGGDRKLVRLSKTRDETCNIKLDFLKNEESATSTKNSKPSEHKALFISYPCFLLDERREALDNDARYRYRHHVGVF